MDLTLRLKIKGSFPSLKVFNQVAGCLVLFAKESNLKLQLGGSLPQGTPKNTWKQNRYARKIGV